MARMAWRLMPAASRTRSRQLRKASQYTEGLCSTTPVAGVMRVCSTVSTATTLPDVSKRPTLTAVVPRSAPMR